MGLAKAVTRVFILANELGVSSKAIVEKCQAENLDIKNHMSTISAGLAATIREWFSEGNHSTTLETADRVDLEKVRVPRRLRHKEGEAGTAEELAQAEVSGAETAGEAETSPSVPGEVIAAAVDEVPAVPPIAETPVVEAGVSVPAMESGAPTAEAAALATAEPKTDAAPAGEPAAALEPPKPPVILPGGPMLGTPRPAKLTGPTIIRVEAAEPDDKFHRKPRPSTGPRTPRPKYDKPISEPLLPAGMGSTILGKGKKDKGPVPKGAAAKGAAPSRDRTQGRRKREPEPVADDARAKDFKKLRERDMEDRRARLAAAGGESLRARPSRRIEGKRALETHPTTRPEKAVVREPITVKDLSAALFAKTSEVIHKLLAQGILATANQTLSTEVAELVAVEMGTELIVERKQSGEQQVDAEFAARARTELTKRPPIVAILGHVDHGKTSLLDKIRSTSVAAGEAGGITQHIGAFNVEKNGRKVTFLDTPGHEAFTAMRARGANMTDIVILVVAADDGVMPQTVEAIHHAKAAGVSIVVAINKIDLPGVDLHRVYGQLSEQGLVPAEWGGDTEIVKTSATTGQGIDELIEYLDYIAELKDYKADSTIPAMGWVVEAKMTSTQGSVTTLLVKEGVLSKGDVVLAGTAYGRVRSLFDDWGKKLKHATSSMAVGITGLDGVAQAGDKFFCLDDINRAKSISEENKFLSRERSLAHRSQVTLENLFSQIEAGKIKELNLIVKADVQGSIDMLPKFLTDLSAKEIQIKILHAAVGGVNEGDVVLAEASGAIIIGFNVVADEKVREMAEAKGVDFRFYNVIYKIADDLRDAMTGMLEPEQQEKTLGRLVVRNLFKVSSVGTIAGCYVTSGVVTKKARLRLIRSNIVLRDNCQIDSLKHFKDDVREVKAGFECGVKIVGFDDIKVEDVFEAFEIVEVARTL
jgi:translation initiation factor IF-2